MSAGRRACVPKPVRRSGGAISRAIAIRRVTGRLAAESFPRLQMALLVGVTAGFGLLASFGMLRLGIESMTLRYPLALALAYDFFLFLIWLWLRSKASDYLDLPDVPGLIARPQPSACPTEFSGEGGQFGGGGASGSFDASSGAFDDSADAVDGVASSEPIGEPLAAMVEADEFAIPLMAIALAMGLALASLYVVYIAPVLFAEVLVDGALSYALFRHLRTRNARHWLSSAFRRTAIPFAVTAVFLVGAGAALSAYAPGARSIGEVVAYAEVQRSNR